MVEDEELMSLLKPDEVAKIEKIASGFSPESLDEVLSDLVRREVGLLRDPRFADDSAMRELTLLNIAALVAAAALADDDISPDRTGTPDTGNAPDGPGSPRPLG